MVKVAQGNLGQLTPVDQPVTPLGDLGGGRFNDNSNSTAQFATPEFFDASGNQSIPQHNLMEHNGIVYDNVDDLEAAQEQSKRDHEAFTKRFNAQEEAAGNRPTDIRNLVPNEVKSFANSPVGQWMDPSALKNTVHGVGTDLVEGANMASQAIQGKTYERPQWLEGHPSFVRGVGQLGRDLSSDTLGTIGRIGAGKGGLWNFVGVPKVGWGGNIANTAKNVAAKPKPANRVGIVTPPVGKVDKARDIGGNIVKEYRNLEGSNRVQNDATHVQG